ncbi:MAG: SCO family protein [Gammaproteobacteria bacterium]
MPLLGTLALACTLFAHAVQADIERRAIEVSQAAIGNEVAALRFLDPQGRARGLEEFRGQPVVLSLVFTACAYSCEVSTRQLDRVVQVARNALGQDSFTVLTVGFDQPVDTPEQMAAYARRHGINDPNWHFLSSPDTQTVAALMSSVGFLSQPSPRGYDHTVQITLLDREGRVARQVYGEVFPTPQLVEPLKDLVFNRSLSEAGLLGRLGDRVRLFCTVYDAQGDRYHFDYSLFAGIFIGVLVIGSAILWLLLEYRGFRRRRSA